MIIHFIHILGHRKGARDDVSEALRAGPITLGRDQERCAVWFHPDDDCVSRSHARVGRSADGLWVEDLGSPNGTTLDEAPIHKQTPLVSGAVLRLGRHAAVELFVGDGLSPGPVPGRRSKPLVLGGAFLVVCALLSLVVFGWSARQRLARSRQSLDVMAAVLAETSRNGAPLDLDYYEVDPRVEAAIRLARANAAAAPAPDPDEDPLAAHLQRVLSDLSGGEVTTVNRLLRDEVARELPGLVRQTRDRPGGRNGAWCRAPELRPELERILKDAMEPDHRPRAHWISYIPWIESEYWPDPPLGGAGERGPWQFIPKTGERYGLIAGTTDRRCQIQAATEAAARLFTDNFAACTPRFPLLAVAAFNTGAHNSCKLAQDESIPEDERDVLGFIARGRLHEVTHDYVPRWLAASFLGDHPEQALLVALEYDPNVGGLPECDAADKRIPKDGPC